MQKKSFIPVKEFEKTFWGKLHKKLRPFLELPKSKKERDALQKRIIASLLGEDPPKDLPTPPHPGPYLEYLHELLYEYGEIEEVTKRIRLSSVLVSSFPFSKRGVSKVEYLRYHYEAYLNEIYIFDQRVNRLLTLIEKRCKKAKLFREAELVQKTRIDIRAALKNICKVRGRHVHLHRYQDRKIEQLEYLDNFKNFDFLSEIRDSEYKELRKNAKKEMITTADALEKILNTSIGVRLEGVLFDRLPACYKKRKS